MILVFDGVNIPSEQCVFDRLYYYYKLANSLLEQFADSTQAEKYPILCQSKELRKEIYDEHYEMSLLRNYKYYWQSSIKNIYMEYQSAIADMNKFSGVLGYSNLRSYLYDVQDYASYGLNSLENLFKISNVDTKDFFKDNSL